MKNLLLSKCMLTIGLLIMSLAVSFPLLSQVKVSGKVFEGASSGVIAGANVVEKGTNNGVVTDINGEFVITVSTEKAILVVSFLGFNSEEISLNGRRYLEIYLQENLVVMDECVVVGYGGQKQFSMVGSVSNAISIKPNRRSQRFFGSSPAATFYNPSIETYSLVSETGFNYCLSNPLSTFSISVDKASYSNLRRFINQGQMPPADAVRIEEMINYFNYDYKQPTGTHPFSVSAEYSDCPWQPNHKLLHVGLQGIDIATEDLPASNLVFLIDISGSMASDNRLPLVKAGFKMLVDKLRPIDNVAIVVYANNVSCVLPSTSGSEKKKINDAIDALVASGGTAGGDGIQRAYQIAVNNFIPKGNNRVILATDGDFNIGISNENDLKRFIEQKRKTGVYLTCLGFGMGNYKDSRMEILSKEGNGNYAYIDNMQEAQKIFIQEFGGTLFTIAKDVKLQIDFNPANVQAYRLVGYDNRMLNNEDFKDDDKDAGDMGAGHSVTAIYEIIPTGVKSSFVNAPDASQYSNVDFNRSSKTSRDVATVRIRYKQPDGDVSTEFRHVVKDQGIKISSTSDNYRYSAAVAMFGMILRDSEYKGTSDYDKVASMARSARGKDEDGYRAEFVRLVNATQSIDNRQTIGQLD